MRRSVPFVAGLLFALGLGIAGMTDPARVIAFLDMFGRWDPSLAFVMAGALLVHLPFVQWSRARRDRAQPSSATKAAPGVDRRLVSGALLFGVGWGLSGLCPGPAFVSLASFTPPLRVFVVSLFAGMALVALFATPDG